MSMDTEEEENAAESLVIDGGKKRCTGQTMKGSYSAKIEEKIYNTWIPVGA